MNIYFSGLSVTALQGHIQDFCNGVSISKKLQEYNLFGISSDQLLTVYILLAYMQKLEIYVSMYTVCKAPSACLFLGGLGACPQQKIFEN